MANFVTDNTALPGPKHRLSAPPANWDPDGWISSDDYNAVTQALYDVRGALSSGVGGGLTPVATVAALRAGSYHTTQTLVYLAGYAGPHDGAEGIWVWDAASTAADNSGTVIKPSAVGGAGRWLRVGVTNVLNVRWFGAVANGSTDCQPAIKACCDALSFKGGVVYFPAGTGNYYGLGSSVLLYNRAGVNDYSNITFLGDGWGSWIKPLIPLMGIYGPFAFGYSAVNPPTLRNVGFRNLRLSGYDETTDGVAQIVSISGSDGSFFDGCMIDTNRNEGVYWNSPVSNFNARITNCYATRIGGWSAVTVGGPLSAYNINVSGLKMYGNRAYQCGLGIESTGDDATITGNVFEAIAQQSGAAPQTALSMNSTFAGKRSIVANNLIKDANIGISYSEGSGFDVIEGNIIENCNAGIGINPSVGSVTVRGNTINGARNNSNSSAIYQTAGFAGTNAPCLIEGNTILTGTTPWATGISVAVAASVATVVRNNVIRGNGTRITAGSAIISVHASNLVAEVIENQFFALDGYDARYYWRGTNLNIVNAGFISGLDSGTILSNTRASRVYSTAAPSVGAWNKGDVCINQSPSSGGVHSWICTTAGTPGTWTALTLS